ncbi:MAG: hypothetical protein KA419_03070 [Acidobacteria bacterium]|nr:hypothetical protein [Acidobacteriota bacterium]
MEVSKRGRECFRKGAALASHPILPVEIPFEGTTLPGYLCLVDRSGAKRPLLVVDSAEDKDLPGQAPKLHEALKCPKTFLLFTKEEGAEEHCQMGALLISNAKILDWLDTVLKPAGPVRRPVKTGGGSKP